jgi:hypothetical protein
MINHVKQKHSDGCGAACLAMLLFIDYESARRVLPGHTNFSTMHKVVSKIVMPDTFLLLVGDEKRRHWVVLHNGVHYDPAFKQPTKKLNRRYARILDTRPLFQQTV